MRPWCQVGSTRRCQRRRPGSSPGGRSRGALDGREGGLHPPARGSIPRGSIHALGRAWWRGSAVSRVRRVRLPPRALLAVAQRIRAPPCEGGGRRFESSRRDTTLRRRSRRLQGCARREAGSKRGIPLGGIPLANKHRRRAGREGTALIRRGAWFDSTVVDPTRPWPREPPGRRGDWPPHRLRASEIAGSSPADQILALPGERRAVEERLSSRAS